ncbi:U-box-domain-containing protein, partial [Rhizoclosmatium globosum]
MDSFLDNLFGSLSGPRPNAAILGPPRKPLRCPNAAAAQFRIPGRVLVLRPIIDNNPTTNAPPMDSRSASHNNSYSSSSRPSANTTPSFADTPVNPAEQAKLEGNSHFANHRYPEAIKAYSVAIIRNPGNPVYYSNRALCHLRLEEWLHTVDDCERGLELVGGGSSPGTATNPGIVMKLWYYKGQALLAMEEKAEEEGRDGTGRLGEAINCLKKAFDLSIKEKSTYVEEISEKYRSAKSQRFERQDRKRREDVSDLHRYLVRLVERDRDRQVGQLGESSAALDGEGVKLEAAQRISEIEALFSQANENSKRRYVPDAFLGKISFEIMTDPVVSPPSGITYDRAEIVSHLQKIGKWDPLTRQPLHEAQLVPNLALKEVIDEFLSQNGWAFDY